MTRSSRSAPSTPLEYVRTRSTPRRPGLGQEPVVPDRWQGFKEFTTGTARLPRHDGLVGVFEDLSPEASKLIDALGVKGLKNVTFASGYDGTGFRDVVEMDMPGPRKGLLALTSTKKFSLKDLPPLPSDATKFGRRCRSRLQARPRCPLNLIESGVRIFAPDQAENIQPGLKAIEQVIGVNFKDDVFSCFGDMSVSYASPAEGPLTLGSTALFKVKNGAKLVQSIETIVKNIPNMQGFEVSLKKKMYRDCEIMDLYLKANEFSNRLGTFAVYKDWFIFSQYPQGVKGFVLRSNGELPTWKPSAEVTQVLGQFPAKEFVAIQVSDPRPTIEFLLSLMRRSSWTWPASSTYRCCRNLRPFDLDLIPHAQEATRGLLPSVSITTDNGPAALRTRGRVSSGRIGLP